MTRKAHAYLIGLDVGTTGCKACVFDETGAISGYGFREYDVICDEPGKGEQDAERVWRLTVEVLREAVKKSGAKDIKALSVSVQGDAIIPVSSDFLPIGNAILGMDYRPAPYSDVAGKLLGDRNLFQMTGMRPHPINSLVKMMWLKEKKPEIFSRAARLVTYADFILGKLGAEPVIDHTMASRTMAFDLCEKKWSDLILSKTEIPAGLLSRPVPSGQVVGALSGVLASELGIGKKTQLVTGGHDQPCAAIGAGVIVEGKGVVSTGTAEVLAAAFDQPALNDAMYEGFYPCYLHAKDGMYFTFSLNHVGGMLFRWYRDNLGSKEVDEARSGGGDPFDAIAGKMPSGPSGLLVLPHFNGSGTPSCDMKSKGAILGLTLGSTRHDIAKAILESLCFELRLNLETMEKAGVKVNDLSAVGGGAKSSAWLQLKADILGRPIRTLATREAACLGAALLAGTAAGVYKSLDEAVSVTVRSRDEYVREPKKSGFYDERYKIYRKLHPALKGINEALQSDAG